MHLLIAAAGAFDKKRAWVGLDPKKPYNYFDFGHFFHMKFEIGSGSEEGPCIPFAFVLP